VYQPQAHHHATSAIGDDILLQSRYGAYLAPKSALGEAPQRANPRDAFVRVAQYLLA
jgi:hypothetical protein